MLGVEIAVIMTYDAIFLICMEQAEITHAILDADGVLWREGQALPGLVEFIGTLRRKQISFCIATNNSDRRPHEYIGIFKGYGVDISSEEVITAAEATALYLRQLQSHVRAFIIGQTGLKDELESKGIEIVNSGWEAGRWVDPPTHVVVGNDRGLGYTEIAKAFSAIKDHGARFIAANPDKYYRAPSGATYPGNGFAVYGLEATTGVKPVIVGKPETAMFDIAMKRMQAVSASTIVVGDNQETDMLAATRLQLQRWLVLSGVTKREEIDIGVVDRVFEDIREVTDFLNGSNSKDDPSSS